jgi:hypothetical protein
MAVFGALIKSAIGGYASKPKVPKYTPVDATAVQRGTIEGNLANLAGAQELAAKQNKFNMEQLSQMLAAAVPGYKDILNQQSGLLQSQLRGEIPKDVQAAIQNAAAGRAVGGGYGGSGMGRNLVARDFGMTSYDITSRAMDSASRWMAATAALTVPNLFDATSMFLSPGQRLEVEFRNTENQFQREWMKNQIAALPDPAKAAIGDAIIQDEQQIMELAGSVAGMAGGIACWVARSVYGPGVAWRLFRHWVLNLAPKWFKRFYLRFGERIARWLDDKPAVKDLIRPWMDKKVEMAYGSILRGS